MIAIGGIGVYCRVSSDDQQERGTIGSQIEFAQKYADLHGLQITNWYNDDGVSGIVPLEKREHGQRLIEDAKNKKIELLLIYKLDRLGRTARLILNAVHELEQCGVMLRSMTESIDTGNSSGQFLITMPAAVAALERETVLERLWHGANRAARSGKWLGGIVPYGYRVNRDGFLEINHDLLPGKQISEAGVIKLIYKLICEQGFTTIQMADYLNALGIPTSYAKDDRKVTKGKRKVNTSGYWLPGRISNIIANPIYKGIHFYGKRTKKQRELIEREMPAIVTEDVWEQARQVLKHNSLECFAHSGQKYLLRGLIKCASCGLTYHGTRYRDKRYYICNGKSAYRWPEQNKCVSKNIPKEWVEDLVWDNCMQFISNPGDLVSELLGTSKEKKSQKEEFEEEKIVISTHVAQKETEKQKILDLYRAGLITNADVEIQMTKISKEKDALSHRISALEKMIAADKVSLNTIATIEGLLTNLREKVKECETSFETKREIVRPLVDKVIINTKTGEKGRLEATLSIYYNFVKGDPCTGRGSWRRRR